MPFRSKSLIPKSKQKIIDGKDSNFMMKVSSIDEYESVLLTFSKPLQPIRNISLIDSTALMITLNQKAKKNFVDNRNLSFSWRTLSMESTTLRIQLKFASPSHIFSPSKLSCLIMIVEL